MHTNVDVLPWNWWCSLYCRGAKNAYWN